MEGTFRGRVFSHYSASMAAIFPNAVCGFRSHPSKRRKQKQFQRLAHSVSGGNRSSTDGRPHYLHELASKVMRHGSNTSIASKKIPLKQRDYGRCKSKLTPALPAQIPAIPLDDVIRAAFRTSFVHFSSPPCMTAFRAFPSADHIFIDELADCISGNGSTSSTHKDAQKRSDARTQQTSDHSSGLGSGTGSDVPASTGPEDRCRPSDSIDRICFFSAMRAVHYFTSPRSRHKESRIVRLFFRIGRFGQLIHLMQKEVQIFRTDFRFQLAK